MSKDFKTTVNIVFNDIKKKMELMCEPMKKLQHRNKN